MGDWVQAWRNGSAAPMGSVIPRPPFQKGDAVCGVGMDIDRDAFFFTLNGALVGEVRIPGLDPAKCVLAVGLHSVGETVRIHVGAEGFWFPIESYSLDSSS